jgi:type II secretory pathway pseudopilin PulG
MSFVSDSAFQWAFIIVISVVSALASIVGVILLPSTDEAKILENAQV